MKSLGVLILVQPCFTRLRQEIGNKKKNKKHGIYVYTSQLSEPMAKTYQRRQKKKENWVLSSNNDRYVSIPVFIFK